MQCVFDCLARRWGWLVASILIGAVLGALAGIWFAWAITPWVVIGGAVAGAIGGASVQFGICYVGCQRGTE